MQNRKETKRMFKKTVKYINFNGEEKSKDLYFHLSKPELIDMAVMDAADKYRAILDNNDVPALLEEIKKLIFDGYGVKSEDGERFEKSEELSKAFVQSPAYEALYMELQTNTQSAIEFFKGMIPQDLADQLDTEKIKREALEAVNK